MFVDILLSTKQAFYYNSAVKELERVVIEYRNSYVRVIENNLEKIQKFQPRVFMQLYNPSVS